MGSLIEEENAEKAKAEEMKRKEEEAIARKKLEGSNFSLILIYLLIRCEFFRCDRQYLKTCSCYVHLFSEVMSP